MIELQVDLAAIAGRINAEHEASEASFCKGIDHAIEAGRLLVEAKSAVEHGGWRTWVETNCLFSYRTARDYMRISKMAARCHFDSCPPQSIRQALDILSDSSDSEDDSDDESDPREQDVGSAEPPPWTLQEAMSRLCTRLHNISVRWPEGYLQVLAAKLHDAAEELTKRGSLRP